MFKNQWAVVEAHVNSGKVKIRDELQSLHRDESGLHIVEIVLILFGAVVILFAIVAFFNKHVFEAVTKAISDFLKVTPPAK